MASVAIAAASTFVAYGKVEAGVTARRGPFLDADGGFLLTRVAVHLTRDTVGYRVGTMVRMLGTQGPIAFHLSPGWFRDESRETPQLSWSEGGFVEGSFQWRPASNVIIAVAGDHRTGKRVGGEHHIESRVTAAVGVLW
jgi:hypothetical protein